MQYIWADRWNKKRFLPILIHINCFQYIISTQNKKKCIYNNDIIWAWSIYSKYVKIHTLMTWTRTKKKEYEAMLQKIKSVNRKGQYDHKHFKLTKKIFRLPGKVPC